MNIFEFIIFILVIIILALIILLWQDIVMFFKPTWFYKVFFTTNSNELIQKLIFKFNKTVDKCVWNDGTYFLKKGLSYNFSAIATWFFEENNPEPRRIDGNNTSIDPKTLSKFQQLSLDGLFYEKKSTYDFLKDNFIIIILVIVIFFMVIYLIQQNSKTTEILYNFTGMKK